MEPARYDERGDIKEGAWLATRRTMFSGVKSAPRDDFTLTAGVTEGAGCIRSGWYAVDTRDRRAAFAVRRGRRL
jgi:hypothetical protein